ncbi:YdgH/BhsA/McbA-like domain containing protein [Klebsiella michiganensis]|uniref:YdgH/BhsA/McbA-like domain containing protein n=1 Tax=Klebsiella michiganensis TaxID=1134687 RepID=UPI0039C0233F
MKNVKLLAAAGMLSLVSFASFASFAQPVSVTADTLDNAEAKIAAIAKDQGQSYHITEAYTGNQVHMTAELSK